jgi:hypothetical protein
MGGTKSPHDNRQRFMPSPPVSLLADSHDLVSHYHPADEPA